MTHFQAPEPFEPVNPAEPPGPSRRAGHGRAAPQDPFTDPEPRDTRPW